MPAPLRPWDAPEITAWNRLPLHTLRHRPSDHGVERLDLDGAWRFELFPTPEQALGLPANVPPASSLPVPACWTVEPFDDVHGVDDRPHYTNVQMPWPDLPPHPPAANPTGVYERDVEVPAGWAGRRVVLHVGAAESVLLVRVDGDDVGISKDSHLAAEFDLTDRLRPGRTSRLRLIVVKWSDATFIEDQDQWWHGGLTRSVALYSTPPVHLADVVADASWDDRAGRARLDLRVEVGAPGGRIEPGWTVRAVLAIGRPDGGDPDGGEVVLGPEAVPVSAPVDSGGDHQVTAGERDPALPPELADRIGLSVAGVPATAADAGLADQARAVRRPAGIGRLSLAAEVPGVRPWTPETPYLNDLVVTLHDPSGTAVEGTSVRVGFRSVRVEGNDLLVNGVRWLVRGVNRHDSDPLGGRVVSAAAMRADLLLLKRFGFNALRTSHYPNDPLVLDLADELGLFVVAEANLECHAFAHHLPSDPAYLGAFVDRVSRLVRRDRNHPSVILWSLGNESGYGSNHDAAAGWVRSADPTRPLHYEGAIMFDWTSGQTASDITCPMYPPLAAIVGHARSGLQRHPLIMCEYSHAMGNSNGTLADHWAAIESTPGLQGGFIWEFCDHGLLQRLADGRPAGRAGAAALAAPSRRPGAAPSGHRWAYGGDFGDVPNDGTFVTDGLVLPDRTPKPAMWEHLQLAAPVRVHPGRTPDVVVVQNHQQAADLSALVGHWSLLVAEDGVGGVGARAAGAAVPAPLPDLAPGARGVLPVPAALRDALDPADGAGPADGATGGEAWLTLTVTSAVAQPWAGAGSALPSAQVQLRPEGRPLLLRAGATGAGAGALAGAPVEVDDDGRLRHPALAGPPALALWRAPTDNDRLGGLAARWERLGVRRLERRPRSVEVDGSRTVVVAGWVTSAGVEVAHTQVLTGFVTRSGGAGVLVEETVELPAELVDLARVGTRLELLGAFDDVEWFGRGPWETYPDRRAAGTIGVHRTPVDDWYTPYLRPQENGGRADVRALRLLPATGPGDGGPAGVTLQLDAPRQVGVSRFTPEDLDAATHADELVARPNLTVHLDAVHRGLGTASCGPDTLADYRPAAGTHTWAWTLTTG